MAGPTTPTEPRIPGPPRLPLVGNLLDVIGAPQDTSVEFANDNHAEYGGIFALDLAGQRQIFASSHELVAQMCSSPLWSKAVHISLEHIRAFGGDGLFTAYNDEPNWGKAHRLLGPAFGTLAIKDYFPQMLDIAEQMMIRWERFGPEHTIDVGDDMTRLTLDTIALCAFDMRFNSFYSENQHPFVGAMVRSLVEAGARGERLPGVQPLLVGKNRQYRDDIATMRQITDEIVTTRMSKPSDQRPQDLLERMLTAADPFTGEKLTAENNQYQLATYELLTHPGVLDTARSLDDVLGNHTPRFEDLAELGYLGQILREALRLHPTAPAFALAPSEPTTLGGYRIEQGEDVMVMLPVLHRDPAVWSDPERFDPDRFAPARMDEIPEYAWMPFGHGARACIGRPFALQEATLVLAMMLQRFDLTFADPRYQMKISETLTIKPKDLAIHVAPRRRDDDIVPASAASQGERPSAEEFAGVAPTADTHGTPLLVLYGSNGGGSESLARTIAADGRARGWASDVAPLDAHVGDLPVEGPVVIVTASYNGTPPDNAREFVTWLTQTRDDLSGVRYLVLGCGSLDWAATYQRVPTVIDEALHAAGATRLRERGATDARTDFFGDWERWYQPLWDDLATAYDLEKVDESGPRYRVVRTDGPDTDHEEVTATVLENRELVRGGPASSKRHLELRLPPGLRYRTGDYLSVLPQNHPELVSRLLTRLRLDPADVVTVESSSPSGRVPIGMPIRVDDLLTRHVDLSSPATPGVVAALSRTTRCPPEREELETLAGDGHADLVLTRRLTLLDLLEAFLSCEVDLAWVLERLPAPRTRQYSISSASEAHSDVSLTVSVVEGPARSGRGTYRGAASHYLQRVRVGERLTVSLASPAEEFRPPRDNSVPIIMIASGSGIAPFRGFVQARLARAAQGEPSGPNVLFFGCRHPDWDDLYAGEFASRVAEGTLEMHRAYSRQPDAGIRYVQHRLLAERGRILDLVHAGAHLYVCGDVSGMGPAVEETLERIGEEAHGAGWLERLRSARRYATDLF